MWRTILILLLCLPCEAAQYFASPNGVVGNAGTIGSPFTLSNALSSFSPAVGGDQIYLLQGTYTGAVTSVLVGGINNSITVSSYPGQWATLDGQSTNDPIILTINGSNVVYRDFEIKNSFNHRDNNYDQAIFQFGPNTKLIDLILHDCGEGVGTWSNAINAEVYGCVIYYNGWFTDHGHGHGIYAQNPSGNRYLRDNILLSQEGEGIQCYSQSGLINGIFSQGNIAAMNGIIQTNQSLTYNYEIGGVPPMTNVTFQTNIAWYPLGQGGNNSIGYIFGATNNGDVSCTGNYFAGGSFIFEQWSNAVVTGNTWIGGPSFLQYYSFVYAVSQTWNNNLYYSTAAAPFLIDGSSKSYANWKAATGFDSSSVLINASQPSTNFIFVRTNIYTPGRANIAIMNWQTNDNVSVDLSQSIPIGTAYNLRNAFNYFGTPVLSGTYSGGTLSIPMTNLAVATPINLPTPTNVSPYFAVFVLDPIGVNSCARSTNFAASASFADVSTAMSTATNGSVVQIPPGTAIWTQELQPPAGVSLIGAGSSNTVIIDELSRSLSEPLINMSGSSFEVSGLVFAGGVTNTQINFNGLIHVNGSNFRIHHNTFWKPFALCGTIVSQNGLIDNNYCNIPFQEAFQTFNQGFGDTSWSTPVQPGTTNELYFEYNWFQDANTLPGIDAYAGSVLAVRYNVFTNTWLGNHGTDSSQRQRGCRWMEVYGNAFVFPPGSQNIPWPWTIYFRSGSGVVWSNTFTGRYTAGVKMATYRNIIDGSVDGSPNWVPWGPANGTSPWDGNTDSLGYPVLDQCGRGLSDLITGSPPINSTTGTAAWPHNASEPIYVWNNTLHIDTSQEAGVQQASIIQNRDYFIGTPKPGYAPLGAHPLASGCFNPIVPPPTPSPKVIVTGNLKVSGNLNILK